MTGSQKEGPANKIGARQNVSFKAVSTAPSINKTPVGNSTPPLPYPTTQDLSNSVATTPSVRFNNALVLVLDQSKQPKGTGDEPGSAKGIRSGTVNGEVKPTDACKTVRCEGKRVVRENDPNTMNGGNNPGIYVTTQKPSGAPPKDAATTSNPPLVPETPKEKSVLGKWWDNAKAEMGAAVAHPGQGAIGAAKGVANIPSELLEMMAQGSASHQADVLRDAAAFQAAMGQAKNAADLAEVAAAMRANVPNIELPKLPINNKAEAGGNLISMAVQLLAGGSGLVKSGLGMLGKIGKVGKVGKAVETAGTVAKAAEAAGTAKAVANAGKAAEVAGAADGVSDAAKIAQAMPGAGGTMQAAKTGARPSGTGVKILERVKKPREQSLERTPVKNAGAGTEAQDKVGAEGKLKGAEGETRFQASDGNLHGGNSTAATLPEGLAYRTDLPSHLAGPDGFAKSGQLSGTHNLNNATASLDGVNGTYTLTPSPTSGISELSYEYVKPVSGKTIFGTKTVYDPAVFSDQAILDLSQQAGQNGFANYLQNPLQKTFDSTHSGINFRTYINLDPKTGAPYVGNVHPIK